MGWVARRRMRLRECFSEEEIRRINRLRFALTKILREFNRVNSKYVAYLEVETWDFESECEKDVFYYVNLHRRVRDPDSESDEFVQIGFYYAVDKDLRDVMGFLSYATISDFEEALDLVLLFVKLFITFYTA
jgi:hypothetical protein